MKKTISLPRLADFSPLIDSGQIVALDVGFDGGVYAVIAQRELDYRRTHPSGASFPKTVPSTPQTYRVVALNGEELVLDVLIEDERFNIHHIQPLPNDELLLACSRSVYRDREAYDRNGRVYSRSGRFSREILLGDGIKTVQTTSAGTIWTSFFDEGVFGNFGWDEPVGASGLVAWDAQGNKLYEFEPPDELDTICDCYALNVESDTTTWLYYYTAFPLVRVNGFRAEAHWDMPIKGSSAFAIAPGYALFRGGYDQPNECYLFELGYGGQFKELARLELAGENGKPLAPTSVIGRGDGLYLVCGYEVYRCGVYDALASI